MQSDITMDDSVVTTAGDRLDIHAPAVVLDGRAGADSGDLRRALAHDINLDGLVINPQNEYGGDVTINGRAALNVRAWDLRLLHADRLSAGVDAGTAFRRALVHDRNDTLTINWGSDYPGGVTVHGAVRMPERLDIGGDLVINTQHAMPPGTPAPQAEAHGGVVGIHLEGSGNISVDPTHAVPNFPDPHLAEQVDRRRQQPLLVAQAIWQLQDQVAALQSQVAELQRQLKP